ncbi:maleate cis-trans isomerase family protein [Halomonas sp. LBP4]|uniref:maleate cis-trans isomerase family protein n=1 Tax=Halomonas sp. LBP4 TaxID=2044917 RepID=UPI000D77025B|nr:maleate cis-trans isomerase [Halomonas sp. LBP4]PXX99419.1 maleate cis-trans isomerase [Halomonas sp. LBP4]
MSLDQCLGILLPEDGPTDYEWYALGPAGASAGGDLPGIEVGKIPSDGHHEPAALTALGAVDRLAPVGEALVHQAGAQAVVWACTSGSFIGGLAGARAQAEGLETALGVPVTSTALAFLEALSALGHRRVDLLSPYPQEVTRRLVHFLGEGGVAVGHLEVLDCPYAADSHRVDIAEAVRTFCREHRDSEVPLLVPDTAVNTLQWLDTLNRQAGRVVLTANQVSLWAGLKRLRWSRMPPRYLNCLASA